MNVGVFFSQTKQLPVCYQLYDGSLVDKVHLLDMMDMADQMDMKVIVFVMDKGFLTKDNLAFLEEKIPFLMAVPASQKTYRQWMSEEISGLESYDNYVGSLKSFGCQTRKKRRRTIRSSEQKNA